MNKDTQKLEETTIKISIRTGVMHKDKADEAQTRIDFTGHYIGTISYFVRVALAAQGHLSMQTDSIVLENDEQFRENLQFAAQLIEAFTEPLPDYASDLAKYSTAKSEQPQAAAPKVEQPQTVSTVAENAAKHRINILANKIGHVLDSDKVSDEFKSALGGVLIDTGNESGVRIDDPVLARAAFPIIMESFNPLYGKAVFATISSLLNSEATDDIIDELRAYEGRFIPQQEETPNVLDLSAQPEDCQRLNKLAVQISEVLKNPLLPERLYNAFSGELVEVTADTDAPEWVLSNLRMMQEADNEN